MLCLTAWYRASRDRNRHCFLDCAQPLVLRFNPSALLTVGDALAFVRMLSEPQSEAAEALTAKLTLRTFDRH